MRHPDSEQVWRYGSTLGVFVAIAGLWGGLVGVGVPGWMLWAGLLVLCGVTAARLWPPHLERAMDARHAIARPVSAFVDPRSRGDDDPGV
jgi:hypothetical protein